MSKVAWLWIGVLLLAAAVVAFWLIAPPAAPRRYRRGREVPGARHPLAVADRQLPDDGLEVIELGVVHRAIGPRWAVEPQLIADDTRDLAEYRQMVRGGARWD